MNNDEKLYKEEPNTILSDEHDLLLDHEYDGIQELDNPMPPWWLYGFYFTIVLSVIYLLYYDVLGWGMTQEQEYEQEVAIAMERFSDIPSSTTIVNYADLEVLYDEISLASGRALYMSPTNLCTTCHGQNAQGLVGPDLTNDYWKHGCDLESIMLSIKNGYPTLGMPPYGSGAVLNDQQLHELASYIITLRGSNPEGGKAPNMARSVECRL